MGLDMYLKKYPKVYKDERKIDLANLDPDDLQRDNPALYLYLKPYEKTAGSGNYTWRTYSEQIGYWRKANQIHNWFVENVQSGIDECQSSFVSREQLAFLLDLCKMVRMSCNLVPGTITNGYLLAANGTEPIYQEGMLIEDSFMAQICLPATSGFFFGSTEYEQYYVQDIDETIAILERVLEETDFEKEEVYYRASW